MIGGAAALAARYPAASATALACVGAAVAAAIQALEGRTPAATVSAAVGGLLSIVGLLGLPDHGIRFLIGGAAALVAIIGIARGHAGRDVVVTTGGAALIATTCDPAYAPLIGVAAIHAVGARPTLMRRWIVAVPMVAVLTSLAVIAAAMFGYRTELLRSWSGAGEAMSTDRIADVPGPIAACASVAGLVLCVVRGRLAAAAVAGVFAMIVVIAVSTAAIPPAVPIVAGLCSGVGLARFAAMIRSPIGQAFVGATTGFILVAAAAWRLVATM